MTCHSHGGETPPEHAAGEDREQGAGTVLVLGIIGVIASVTITLTLLGGALVAAHHARTAADMGSVGAARMLQVDDDTARACSQAALLVEANGAHLRGCQREGADVRVTASVATPAVLRAFGHREAVAVANAGPR